MDLCRRDFLMRSSSGLSALALSSLLQAADNKDPLAPRKPDHTPTAKTFSIETFLATCAVEDVTPKPATER